MQDQAIQLGKGLQHGMHGPLQEGRFLPTNIASPGCMYTYRCGSALTGDVLHEDEAAEDADEDGHHGAAGHVEGVAGVRLQRTALQHAVLVPKVRWVVPAAYAAGLRPRGMTCMIWRDKTLPLWDAIFTPK